MLVILSSQRPKTTFIISHFLGIRNMGWFCWIPFRMSHKVEIKVLARAVVSSEGSVEDAMLPNSPTWLLTAFRFSEVIGLHISSSQIIGQKPLLVLCQIGPFSGQLTAQKLTFPKAKLLRKREYIRAHKQTGSQSFCNLISEVISHHFCCILFIRSKSFSPVPFMEVSTRRQKPSWSILEACQACYFSSVIKCGWGLGCSSVVVCLLSMYESSGVQSPALGGSGGIH